MLLNQYVLVAEVHGSVYTNASMLFASDRIVFYSIIGAFLFFEQFQRNVHIT